MEEIAQVYARALFEVGLERDISDVLREQLGQFSEAIGASHELSVFLFSPYFSTDEKKDGLHRVLDGADPALMNFLELLVEKHRLPAIHRIRRAHEALWQEENKLLPVEVTSAIELDGETVASIAERIGDQTGRKVNITTTVDPDILGGIVLRVGNSILDASIKNRLDRLRRQVIQA